MSIAVTSTISKVCTIGLRCEGHAEHNQMTSSSVVQAQGSIAHHILADVRHDAITHDIVTYSDSLTVTEVINEPRFIQLSTDGSDVTSTD